MMRLIQRAGRKVGRSFRKLVRLRQARKQGLEFIEPNFIFAPALSKDSVVIDAGCSHEADFSLEMIGRYGAKAYAVDPTLKHRPALEKLQSDHAGKFVFLPFAISSGDGDLTFHESKVNESGSLIADHTNVVRDETVSYQVRAVTLGTLLKHIGAGEVDILKLDIEGAEYDLLSGVGRDDLRPFRQIFLEFHHHAVPRYTEADTRRIVSRIEGFGYESFSLDDHNYLFRRTGA